MGGFLFAGIPGVYISVKNRPENTQNYTIMYPFSDKFNTKFNIKSQQLYVIAQPKHFAPSKSNCGSRQTEAIALVKRN